MLSEANRLDESKLAAVVEQISAQGYAVVENLLHKDLVQALLLDIERVDTHRFRQAGIGRGDQAHINDEIRTDRILWLEGRGAAAQDYLAAMTELQNVLNRRLFLGLFDYECHWAYYPRGAFYRRHVDAFRGRSNRRLSTVLYLNAGWQPGDGGELDLYDPSGEQLLARVAPRLGTMAIFLSEEFPHEVLPTCQPRYSVTGWFRVNASINGHLDPAR